MKLRQSVLWQLGMIGFTLVYDLVVITRLPERVPTHWNIHGQVDAYGSRWTTPLIMLGVLVLMLVLTVFLPTVSPKQFEVSRSGAAYGRIMVLVSALMAVMNIVILQATLGANFDIGRAMFTILFAFFAVLGLWIGKLKRNLYLGIRTPWTLADERVWEQTHKQAGKLWVWAGTIGALTTLLGAPYFVPGAMFLVILAPVASSYFIYKRIVR